MGGDDRVSLTILDKLLVISFQQKAKLTLFAEGLPPMFRLPDGSFVKLVEEPLKTQQFDELLGYVLQDERDKFSFTKNKYWVGNYETVTKLRFKVSIFTQRGYRVLQFERLPDLPPKLEDMNLPDTFVELMLKGRGLFVIAGPKGSGKTSRLAACVQHLLNEKSVILLSLEEALEYRYSPAKGIPYQMVLGKDIPTIDDVLEVLPMINPDVVVISELKNRELAKLAIDRAMAGQLVLTTVSADGIQAVLEKIVGFFPLEETEKAFKYLSMALISVVSGNLFKAVEEGEIIYVYDFWYNSPDFARMIASGKIDFIVDKMAESRDQGYRVQEYTLRGLIRKKVIDREEALTKAARPNDLLMLLEKPY